MKKFGLFIIVGVSLAVLTASYTSAQYELVQIVAQRNALMKKMLSAYWPLLKIKNGESSDLASGAESARAIGEATGKIGALFPAGTAKGEVPQTRAKPDIWSKSEDFQAAVETLGDAAASLQAAAEAGDMAAFKSRFDAFTAACTGCHSFRPSGGGKFRFSH